MYKVLVVDDESLPREYLRTMIPSLDSRFEVIGEASDGIEALQFIREHDVDLMITDVRMPEMDGLELCKAVYQEYPEILITVLSGHEEFDYVQEAMLYKTEEYILKPINKQSVTGMLERVAARLDQRTLEKTRLNGLLSLSDEAKKQVANRFLQALISQSHAEISSLYPLVHRMKIPIFEGEGIAMALGLDEHTLFQRLIPHKDYSVFLYILNQVASELASEYEGTWTLFDPLSQTVLLMSGTDKKRVLEQASELYGRIGATLRSIADLAVSGGIGCWIEDIFQLDVSYESALRASYVRFQQGGGFLHENVDQSFEGEYDPIERAAESLRNAEIVPNAAEWASQQLAGMIAAGGGASAVNAYNLGAHILYRLTYRGQGKNSHSFDAAWAGLATLGNMGEQEIAADALVAVYRSVFCFLDGTEEAHSIDEAQDNPSLVEQVLEFVVSHYSEPISLSMIAEKFQITPQYLSRLFHKQTGTSYIKYLTRFRMEQAAMLLTRSDDVKVYEVSELVGYENVKHFLYVFKKHFGVTPGDYKLRNEKMRKGGGG